MKVTCTPEWEHSKIQFLSRKYIMELTAYRFWTGHETSCFREPIGKEKHRLRPEAFSDKPTFNCIHAPVYTLEVVGRKDMILTGRK